MKTTTHAAIVRPTVRAAKATLELKQVRTNLNYRVVGSSAACFLFQMIMLSMHLLRR